MENANVVVIGGGIVGCAVLYHLTKAGVRDTVLLERKQLTAGSTWHAAAGFHALNGDPNVARLQNYTIDLYQEIERISGQNVGMHKPGGVAVAATPERWDFLKAEYTRHKLLGFDSRLITPDEIRSLTPLIDVKSVIGGLFSANEGYVDPHGATHAYAIAARANGARIRTQTMVNALSLRSDGQWEITTEDGVIVANHVVNAAGLWAREVGAMAGVQLPLVPMEHHYLITEEIPELREFDGESVVIVDLDGEIYVRQEHKGALLGVYERDPVPWSVDGTPWEYGETDLLEPRLEHLQDALIRGFARFPSIERAGIKKIVNGPFTFTPDGNPLVGPVPELPNYWVACGVMAGFSQSAGIGLTLAEWIAHGAPKGDVFAMDVARFGDFATPRYTIDRAREFYARRFNIPYPNEYWPAGRPCKTSPAYDLLSAQGAVFSASYGLEAPMWFAHSATEAKEKPVFHRAPSETRVSEEVLACRSSAGVMDITGYAKYEITGPGAARWLDSLCAGRFPARGRIRLAPMLSPEGTLMGDLTLMNLDDDRFFLFGSGYLQNWHMRWFKAHLPPTGVNFRNCSDDYAGFVVAGPNVREALASLIDIDVSNAALSMFSVAQCAIGGAPAFVARLSLTGELGFEIYTPASYARNLYANLLRAGRSVDLRPFGVRALLSMRLEKAFGIWSREFSPDYTPAMSGLSRFIDYDKSDFIGREAALADRAKTPEKKLVLLAVDASDSDAAGFEPVWANGEIAGMTTSGGFGHATQLSLAMAYVGSAHLESGAALSVDVLGERRTATVLDLPPYDPKGARMRM